MAVEHQTQSGTEAGVNPEAMAVPAAAAAPPPPPNAPSSRRPGRVRIKTQPEDPNDSEEPILTPAFVRGFAFSLTVHLLVLFAFALIVLKPPPKPNPLDTRLFGDAHGSELGEELQGGLGIDMPLALPEAPVTFPETAPSLTNADVSPLKPTLSTNAPRPKARSGGQDGVALTGTGQAGNGEGFGVAKFGHGGEVINNVEVKVGNPQFTLIWNNTADLDLHVLEPGGSHLYWEHREGERGGTLDVDDVDGYGPENIFWGEEIGQGNGPPGEYKWFVHYYGAIGGISVPTRWKMRLKHNGKTTIYEGRLAGIGQRTRTYSFTIDGANGSETPEPGTPEETAQAPQDVAKPKPAPDLAAKRAELFAPPVAMRPERDAEGWAIVEPANAGFRAKMPEPPTVERRAASSPRLGDLMVHFYAVDRGEGGYVVTWSDLPPDVAKRDPMTLLDTEAKVAMEELGGTITASRQIAVGAFPGRAVSFDVPDRVVGGGGSARVRVFLADGRLFTAAVVGQKDFVAKPATDKFLNSFQPLERR